jgi:hypothetical protein
MKDRTYEELVDYNQELKTRLMTVIEILHNVTGSRKTMKENVPRLLLRDYVDYLQLADFFTEKDKSAMTTHTIMRHCLTNRNYQELEATLYNLQSLGLVELTVGKQYLQVSLLGSTMFQKQKIKNSRGKE